jgi:hypothetical protein
MKKVLFLTFGFLLMSRMTNGQSLDSIVHHPLHPLSGANSFWPSQIMQQDDGDLLFGVSYSLFDYQTESSKGAGNGYYKVSRHGAMMLDSLFVEEEYPYEPLITRHPQTGENVRVGVLYDSINGESLLQILPFNDDLVFDYPNEIRTHLSDSMAYGVFTLVNPLGDIVILYQNKHASDNPEFFNFDYHFARFGFDGTLKYENVIPRERIHLLILNEMGVFNDSPLEYYLFGYTLVDTSDGGNTACMVSYIINSKFQVTDSIAVFRELGNSYRYSFGWCESIVPQGDEFLFSSRYRRGPFLDETEDGVCVTRYDRQTLEIRNQVFFESNPMVIVPHIALGACPIGLAEASDGACYFAYHTQNPYDTNLGQIAVVKLDAGFNIQWQRFCLEPEGYPKLGQCIETLDDGGVAIFGGYLDRPETFFLIFSDDGVGVHEAESVVRPYMYYPNPVQDQLHMYYSPDVQPRQVELYDLQGRLVRVQNAGFESVDMGCLPTGTYMMRVTLEDGKVNADKVVKE